MPQFQTEYFSSQLFWAIISFFILFYLLNRFIFPVVNRLLDERAEYMRQEIETATEMRKEAEQAAAEHRQMLEEIRQGAQKVMDEVRQESLHYRDKAIASIHEEHHKRKGELFAEIEFAKRKALDDIRSVAVELSIAATEKVIGRHVGQDETEMAVDELIRELRK